MNIFKAPSVPDGWTQREIELFDGMIEVETYHAERCDKIANRVMAEKQKGWDLERVALLRKCKAMLSAPSIPEGWQIVPVEPTPEMITARVGFYDGGRTNAEHSCVVAYKAMLAAAPKGEK